MLSRILLWFSSQHFTVRHGVRTAVEWGPYLAFAAVLGTLLLVVLVGRAPTSSPESP